MSDNISIPLSSIQDAQLKSSNGKEIQAKEIWAKHVRFIQTLVSFRHKSDDSLRAGRKLLTASVMCSQQ